MSLDHKEIIAYVEKMPAFPQSVSKVLELTSRADCSPKELVKVIEHDPVMTMKILKLVNSAFYGLPNPIKSINHGIVYAGFNTIKNMSLTIAAIGVLPRQSKINVDIDDFLLHSLGVGTIAKKLADQLGVGAKDASDYFIAGMLHDFGKIILALFKSDEYQHALDMALQSEKPLFQAEQEIFDIDHSEIGALLAESWKLPETLADCIRHHHQPELKNNIMVDCVFAANQIINFLSFGDSGNRFITPFPESVESRFGKDLQGLIDSIGDIESEMDQARAFISS
jgi:putative nucleotidyltransferase with HDIG domain